MTCYIQLSWALQTEPCFRCRAASSWLLEPEVVHFNTGDVVVFRCDVLHSGAAYEHGHSFHIHCHLDSSVVLHSVGYVAQLNLQARELKTIYQTCKNKAKTK